MVCSASADPTSGIGPLTVNFTGGVTATNCSGTPAYSWDFGDGETSTEQNPIHIYYEDGTYLWSLAVTVDNATCEESARVTVGDTSQCTITCGATALPTGGEAPLTVAFGATATAVNCIGDPYYEWDFGDGCLSEEQNPAHTYQSEGTYVWTMTASVDDKNCSTSGTVTAGEFPEPTVTSVSKVGNPFRLRIIGSDFANGCRILIDGNAVPQTRFKSSGYLIAKKGAALKAMVPKGVAVLVEVENPDGAMSNSFRYTR